MEHGKESSLDSNTLVDEVQARSSSVCVGGHNKDRSRVSQSGRVLRNRQYRRAFAEQRDSKRLFTPEIKAHLKDWLIRRRRHPYPNRAEKRGLAHETGLTYIQICNWFANWRRKLKNVSVSEVSNSLDGGIAWSHRIVTYNKRAEGNVEQLSISSEDSIWECGDPKASDATRAPVSVCITSEPVEMETDDAPCVACMDHSYSTSTPLEPQCLTVSSTTSEPEDTALASCTTPKCYEMTPTFRTSTSTSIKKPCQKPKSTSHKMTPRCDGSPSARHKSTHTSQALSSASSRTTSARLEATSASQAMQTSHKLTSASLKSVPTSHESTTTSHKMAQTVQKPPSTKTRSESHESTSAKIKESSKAKKHTRCGTEKREVDVSNRRRLMTEDKCETKADEVTPMLLSKWLASAANFQPATSSYCSVPCRNEASWMTASRCAQERGVFSHQRAELEAAETLTRLARLHH